MLEPLSSGGTTIVRNTGTDVTIFCAKKHIDILLKLYKTIVVTGISTAILEVTDLETIDEKTIGIYLKEIKPAIIVGENVMCAMKHLLKDDNKFTYLDDVDEKTFIRFVKDFMRN